MRYKYSSPNDIFYSNVSQKTFQADYSQFLFLLVFPIPGLNELLGSNF